VHRVQKVLSNNGFRMASCFCCLSQNDLACLAHCRQGSQQKSWKTVRLFLQDQDQDFMIQDQDFHFCPRDASRPRPWSRGLHHCCAECRWCHWCITVSLQNESCNWKKSLSRIQHVPYCSLYSVVKSLFVFQSESAIGFSSMWQWLSRIFLYEQVYFHLFSAFYMLMHFVCWCSVMCMMMSL